MLEIFLSIAPIFILIALGYGLWRVGIPSVEFWNLNDKLVYWVLFPALLFHKTSTIELSGTLVGSYAIVIISGFISAIIFSLVTTWLFKLDQPVKSSVLQGSARHNTFVALAMAESLFGNEGLSLAALIAAILIPVTNIVVVSSMVMISQGKQQGHLLRAILRDLARNPILVSVLIGLSVNLAKVGNIPIVHDIAQILGGAALPVVLLCIGANIRLRAMTGATVPMALAILGKMIVFPGVVLLLAHAIGLSELAMLIAVLFGAMPTAASSYTLARQMEGDAPLMAAIVTTQTGLAFITVPITLTLVQHFFGGY
jgi:malonate transporter and related proteins